MYDAPSPEERSERNRGVRAELHPVWNGLGAGQMHVPQDAGLRSEEALRRHEESHNDAHRLLRIVGAMR